MTHSSIAQKNATPRQYHAWRAKIHGCVATPTANRHRPDVGRRAQLDCIVILEILLAALIAVICLYNNYTANLVLLAAIIIVNFIGFIIRDTKIFLDLFCRKDQ